MHTHIVVGVHMYNALYKVSHRRSGHTQAFMNHASMIAVRSSPSSLLLLHWCPIIHWAEALMRLLLAAVWPVTVNTQEVFVSAVASNTPGVHAAYPTGSCTRLAPSQWNTIPGNRRTRFPPVQPMEFAIRLSGFSEFLEEGFQGTQRYSRIPDTILMLQQNCEEIKRRKHVQHDWPLHPQGPGMIRHRPLLSLAQRSGQMSSTEAEANSLPDIPLQTC